ncbi:hypothetical protein Ancab_040049 [Ancistrocladus abbreviatus]
MQGLNMKSVFSSFRIIFRNISTQSSALGKKPRSPRTQKVEWTDQQLEILSAISNGMSILITGSAGSGKTILVKEIIKLLKKIHGRSAVFVTASTGVAACALDGQTLHSFAGIGVAAVRREDLLSKVCSDRKALRRWKDAKALVIDEISMVDAELFDNLEYIARAVRVKFRDKCWGGLQLVVSGDFFQLPPVVNEQNSVGKEELAFTERKMVDGFAFGVQTKEGKIAFSEQTNVKEFAFEANCWNSSFDLQMELSTVFRQSDAKLIKLLQGIRRGVCDDEDIRLIKQRSFKTEPEVSVVRLYPRNQDVSRVNERRLSSLGETIVAYHALDVGLDLWKKQLAQGITPTCLEICIGARVMLTKNIDVKSKLVNGAAGTVTGFQMTNGSRIWNVCSSDGSGLLPIVRFDSGQEFVIEPETWAVMEGDKVFARRMQIPLVLAWAMSIHKCQGMTLDSLHTDLSRSFGYGMVYVALSRVRSLEGLHLSGFKRRMIKAHPKVLQFYERLSNPKQGGGIYQRNL